MTVDHIDALGKLATDLEKAGGHKYRSKKKVNGKWVYDYGPGGKPKRRGKKVPEGQLSLFGESDSDRKQHAVSHGSTGGINPHVKIKTDPGPSRSEVRTAAKKGDLTTLFMHPDDARAVAENFGRAMAHPGAEGLMAETFRAKGEKGLRAKLEGIKGLTKPQIEGIMNAARSHATTLQVMEQESTRTTVDDHDVIAAATKFRELGLARESRGRFLAPAIMPTSKKIAALQAAIEGGYGVTGAPIQSDHHFVLHPPSSGVGEPPDERLQWYLDRKAEVAAINQAAKERKEAATSPLGDDGLTDHQRQRKERAEARAERLQREGERKWEASGDEVRNIPMGQPILVGHHSEKKHRRALERQDRKARDAVNTLDEAKSARYAAKRAGNAISSDDPHAVQALEVKLAGLEAKRDEIKKYNKGKKKGPMFASDRDLREGGYKLPGYVLTNLGSEIRRVKKRIEELGAKEEAPEMKPIKGDGFEIVEDKGDNRLRMYFDGKPSAEVRKRLKSRGFRWSPSEGAWQRHISNGARYEAEAIAKEHFGHTPEAAEKPAAAPQPARELSVEAGFDPKHGGSGKRHDAETFVHIQSVGQVPSKSADRLNPGDRLIWNGGSTSEVVAVERLSPKFVRVVTQRDGAAPGEYDHTRMKVDRQTALDPDHHAFGGDDPASAAEARAKKSMTMKDPIDALESLYKSSDDDEAYMLGYKDAQAGKPAKPAAAAPQVDQEEEDGDTDGEIENAPDGEETPNGDDQAQEPDAIDALGDQDGDEEPKDLDGDGDADTPGGDVDGDGEISEEEQLDPEAQGEEQGAEGEDVEGAPGEGLPQDDGENYGVGDLNEDGQTQSLVQEITELEKLYYAAKGLHGGGHHKTEKALDLYHRAVRKLVRAQMGQGGGEPGDEDVQGQEGTQAPQEGQGDEDGAQDGQKPPFGKKDDEGGGGDDEDEKKKKPFGKSFALDPLDALILEVGEPHEIRPVLDRLIKAGPSMSKGQNYVSQFVNHCVSAAKSGNQAVPGAGPLTDLVIAKMVDRFAHDPMLRDAASEFAITTDSVRPLVETALGMPAREDRSMPGESAQHAAMGCEHMAYSMTGSDLKVTDNVLAKSAEGLQVVDHTPRPAALVDDRVDPSAALRKAQRDRIRSLYSSGDQPVKVTVSAECPFHGKGEEAIYKSHLIHNGYLRCTCPR